jgi:hypothetical protein
MNGKNTHTHIHIKKKKKKERKEKKKRKSCSPDRRHDVEKMAAREREVRYGGLAQHNGTALLPHPRTRLVRFQDNTRSRIEHHVRKGKCAFGELIIEKKKDKKIKK